MEKKEVFNLDKQIESLSPPPGENEDAYKNRVKDKFQEIFNLGYFSEQQAFNIAKLWARETPQTPEEVRRGRVWEEEQRIKTAAKHFTKQNITTPDSQKNQAD